MKHIHIRPQQTDEAIAHRLLEVIDKHPHQSDSFVYYCFRGDRGRLTYVFKSLETNQTIIRDDRGGYMVATPYDRATTKKHMATLRAHLLERTGTLGITYQELQDKVPIECLPYMNVVLNTLVDQKVIDRGRTLYRKAA